MAATDDRRGLADSDAVTSPQGGRRAAPQGKLGRFDVVGPLGSGGMGAVFRAVDTRTGKEVALKRLFDLEPTGVYRLKREFRRMCGIVHENLVSLYELVHEEGEWFFTMELLAGVDLHDALRAGLLDNYAGVRTLLRQLVRAVQAIHGAGKIHRDLKPENVLVTAAGRLVVLDFGLVDEVDHRTLFGSSAGRVFGTPAYMAPEQAAGHFATPASDWYAVGAILFEALTGRHAFDGDVLSCLARKQREDAPRASSVDPQIPPDLDELVAALMRRAPDERAGAAEILSWCAGRSTRPSYRGAPVSAGPLIERERAMTALHGALDRVLRGESVCVEVAGPAGAGKTELVRHFARQAAELGVTCLEGVCSPQESLPYRAFDGLVDGVTAQLARLGEEALASLVRDHGAHLGAMARIFPVLGRLRVVAALPVREVEAHELRRQAFEGTRRVLGWLAERRPTMVFLDDLQWGDADSAHLLEYLLGIPGGPAALFVLAYRPGDGPVARGLATQRVLGGHPRVSESIELKPLTPAGALTLAHRLLGPDPPAALTRSVARESEGNPALLRALAEEVTRHGGDEGTLGSGEELLRRLVRARLARVSPEARPLLALVVVAARPLPAQVLHRAGVSRAELPVLAAQLARQDLLTVAGEGDALVLTPPGESIAQAVRATFEPAQAFLAHDALARAYLAADFGGPEALARHLLAAGRDDEAAEHASSAAYAAGQACAFDRAAEFYRLALVGRPGDRALQRRAAEALVLAGRGAEAGPLFLAAAEGAPAAAAAHLRRCAAEHSFNHGDLVRGAEILRSLLHDAGIEVPARSGGLRREFIHETVRLVQRGLEFDERGEMQVAAATLSRIDLLWIAGKGVLLSDPGRSGYFLTRCLLLALDAGEPRRIIRALALCGLLYSGAGHSHGSLMLARSQALVERLPDPYGVGLAAICRGIAARYRGRWVVALAELERGVDHLREHCPGATWECGLAHASMMVALEALGELRTLAERAEVVARRARETGDGHSGLMAAIYSALPLVAAGHTARARARVREALSHWPREGLQSHHLHALKIDVFCDLYEGRAAAAWRRIDEAWSTLERSGLLTAATRRTEALLLRVRAGVAALAVTGAEQRRIRTCVADALSELEGRAHAHETASAALLRAGFSSCLSDPKGFLRALDVARVGFDAAGMSLGSAVVRRIHGRLAGSAGAHAVAYADALMRMQGIADIDAWMRVAAPGLL